jgi:hypothetical protein
MKFNIFKIPVRLLFIVHMRGDTFEIKNKPKTRHPFINEIDSKPRLIP